MRWRIFNPAHGWRLLDAARLAAPAPQLCVIDGDIAFCGGINLLDDHHDPNHGAPEQPRPDFAVRARPLVEDARHHDAPVVAAADRAQAAPVDAEGAR